MIADVSFVEGCVYVGFVLLIILAVVAFVGCKMEQQAEQEKLQREAQECQREQKRQKELERQKQELEAEFARRTKETQQQAQDALDSAIVEMRQAAEERFRGSITAENLEELAQKLRGAQEMFSRTGRVITARVFSVPTGWVGIEWMLDPGMPVPLKVVCRRDGKIIFVEHAYRGLFGDILQRGKEYHFSFQAFEGKHDREDDLQFVVKIATPLQAARKLSAGPQLEDELTRRETIVKRVKALTSTDEAWEQGRREGHQQIDGSDGPVIEKQRRKARLDAQIVKERDAAQE